MLNNIFQEVVLGLCRLFLDARRSMAHTSACLSYIPTHAGCQSYCNTAYLAVHGCLPCMYVFAYFVCIVACLALDHCLLCNEWSPVCYVWLPALLWTGCLPCYGLVACLAMDWLPALL
jgi:hypothetical protein